MQPIDPVVMCRYVICFDEWCSCFAGTTTPRAPFACMLVQMLRMLSL